MSDDMFTLIALFRGINVGGRNTLSMKDLVGILEVIGFEDINTYIQSGNVVFRSRKPCSGETARELALNIKQSHGFEPAVILLTVAELQEAISSSPFQAEDGKTLHYYFLDSIPANPNLEKLMDMKTPSENFSLQGSVFYLLAPDGIGRSKLAAAVEAKLGVSVTARNFNTVKKLLSMIGI
jgi:uncharacterized protein (DUF1697 family)